MRKRQTILKTDGLKTKTWSSYATYSAIVKWSMFTGRKLTRHLLDGQKSAAATVDVDDNTGNNDEVYVWPWYYISVFQASVVLCQCVTYIYHVYRRAFQDKSTWGNGFYIMSISTRTITTYVTMLTVFSCLHVLLQKIYYTLPH